MISKAFAIVLTLIFTAGVAAAQKAEVTVVLNEQFFDAFVDSVYQNFDPPQFNIAGIETARAGDEIAGYPLFQDLKALNGGPTNTAEPSCSESITVLREMRGVRTAVKFRNGRVYMPIAFSGEHALPIIGCVQFAGWAEANIDLQFDAESQRLLGRANVFNVNLNGTAGIGGSLIARMLQGTLDSKLNPIPLMNLDKLNIGVPVPSSGSLRMIPTDAKTEVQNGSLNVIVS
ncbi:MAG: hypothetical protein JO053_05600, partial [Acidobacteria bacterium]|nr:hypothetical protein [Acidobacteriota bacterium]